MLYANTVLLDTMDLRSVYLVCEILEPSPDDYQMTTGMYQRDHVLLNFVSLKPTHHLVSTGKWSRDAYTTSFWLDTQLIAAGYVKPRLLKLQLKGQGTTVGLPYNQCICCNIHDACVVGVEQEQWILKNQCTRKASRCQLEGWSPTLTSFNEKQIQWKLWVTHRINTAAKEMGSKCKEKPRTRTRSPAKATCQACLRSWALPDEFWGITSELDVPWQALSVSEARRFCYKFLCSRHCHCQLHAIATTMAAGHLTISLLL